MSINTIELICDTCGKKFNRRKTEYNRCKKRGLKRVFCGFKCCGYGVVNNIPPELLGNCDNLITGSQPDIYSQFRWHLRNAKRRKKYECLITLEHLKCLWEQQEGKCPYTGWELKNLATMNYSDQLPLTPDRASLDRIDSSKGYIKGNVQFVSYMAQCAKNRFGEEDLINFCEAVTNGYNREHSVSQKASDEQEDK